MHRLFSQAPYLSRIPWSETHLFWVDERMVPHRNPASNFGAAKLDFLDQVPLPPHHVHPMPVSGTPEKVAILYQREIRDVLKVRGDEMPAFDLICLGLGTDGHTASLFPGEPSLEVKDRWIVPVKGGNPNTCRLTMTYPILNSGKNILFLAMGAEKADIVRRVIDEKDETLPAQRVGPVHGKMIWLLDREAASLLRRGNTGRSP